MFRGEVRLRVFLVDDRLYTLSLIKVDKVFDANEKAVNINSFCHSS